MNANFYIKMMSQFSDQYGNELIKMMEQYKKQNLREITFSEAKEYYESLITMRSDGKEYNYRDKGEI